MNATSLNYEDDDYQDDWPSKEYFVPKQVTTKKQLQEFKRLVSQDAGETSLDSFIRRNSAVLALSLWETRTGHHGAWVLSQPVIKTQIFPNDMGLIPDYIVGGLNSNGFSWRVIELKGADSKMFAGKGKKVYFSQTLNQAICQTLQYLDYCSRFQNKFRDEFKLKDFREPKGLILLGREQELKSDAQKQELRSVWNREFGGKLEIRTYDFLVRACEDAYRISQSKEKHWKEFLKQHGSKLRKPAK